MEFRILGPLDVIGKEGSLSLPKGRGRSLLAMLALCPGQAVSIDRLIDQLWGPTPPATARTKLYGLISTLRKALEPGVRDHMVIQTKSPGYVLNAHPDQVDGFRFRRLVRTAGDLPASEKTRVLNEALDLWRGTALADFTYEPFAQSEIMSLTAMRITALEDRIAAQLELGHDSALVAELEALVRENPYRERLRGQAMLAMYRSENQQQALRLYREAYQTFGDDLGIQPGPELQKLEEAILNQDPGLDVTPATSTSRDDEQILEEDPDEHWLSESRRIVSVTYIDLGLPATAQSDPEANRSMARRAHETITETLRSHGGTTQAAIGGVIVSVFGMPVTHEDDPLRAVRAATETLQALAVLGSDGVDKPMARIGINTGEVVLGVTGLAGSGPPQDTVRVAARLQQSAGSGEILIGDRTRQLAGSAVTVEPLTTTILDDALRTVTAWKLVETDPISSDSLARRNTPWVGRQNELTSVLDVFARTVGTGRPHRMTVIGFAGIGKSRLGIEFTDALDDQALVLTGHCPPYGEGITFWPLREMINQAAVGIEEKTINRLLNSAGNPLSFADHTADAIDSIEPPPRPDVLFPSLRSFFESLAKDRPLVLILEDVHWAQPTFIDLVDYLEESAEGPLMLLCMARPEFLDTALVSPGRRDDANVLMLEPLDGAAVDQLVNLHLTKHDVSRERAQAAVEIAEGNPLFIEQILATLQDHDKPTIPPSIQALLVARLDRLGPAERDLIRSASVLGMQFRVDNLKHLIPSRARDTVSRHLESLEQKALISAQDDGTLFEFRHALIQLVSYQTLTKETRATLHARVGALLDQSRADDAENEVAGYHFEKASEYLSELGIEDAYSHQMASKAAERLTHAGLRAFALFDMPAAENLLGRAVALLGRDLPDWWTVSRRLAEVDQMMGRHDKAIEAFDGLIEEAMLGGDEPMEHFFRLEKDWAQIAIGPDPISLETIEEEIKRGQIFYEKEADDAGLAQVFRLMLHIHYRRGRMPEMESAGRRELDHALKSRHPREIIGGQWLLAMAFEEGLRPVTECIELCQDLRHWGGTENPGVVSTLGHLLAMSGEFEKARAMSDKARQLLRERVRARRPNGHVIWKAGEVELLAGNIALAEQQLREALHLNLEMGEMDMICQIAANLSQMLAREGEIEEAASFATMSRNHAPAQSVPAQAVWRSALALTYSLNDKFEEAESLGREALALVPAEMLNLGAALSVDLGEVLLKAGQRAHGTEMIRKAIELFQEKGNTAGAARAEAIIK